jgi:class 3 adenylate cyclase
VGRREIDIDICTWRKLDIFGNGSGYATIDAPGEAMKQPVERRLAAILAADVAGYSRLMGADEEGTLQRLKAHRRELIDPKIKEHRGRIVKIAGDGMLAEFASVVDAVRCAVEVQRTMIDRNADVPEDKRITCPSQTYQTTRTRNILPTGSPTTSRRTCRDFPIVL